MFSLKKIARKGLINVDTYMVIQDRLIKSSELD